MAPEPTLVFFSGLAADQRLLAAQRALPWPVEVVPWIRPQPRETLSSYAERMVEHIHAPSPYFLGGVSLGGMIALEVSRWTRPQAVFLIASAPSARGIAPLWRSVGRLVGLMPLPLFGAGLALLKPFSPAMRELRGEHLERVREMSRDASPQFVRWACRAATTWTGVDLPHAPVFHIHGDRDRVMPLRRLKPDYIVRGGGHMIVMTHAEEVNRYLADRVRAILQKL